MGHAPPRPEGSGNSSSLLPSAYKLLVVVTGLTIVLWEVFGDDMSSPLLACFGAMLLVGVRAGPFVVELTSAWSTPPPPPPPSWEDEVQRLYARSEDMTVGEFERLLEVAMTGERPDHPDLPLFLPFALETVER